MYTTFISFFFIPGAVPNADGWPNEVEPNPVLCVFVPPPNAGAEVVVFPRNEKLPNPPARKKNKFKINISNPKTHFVWKCLSGHK